MALYSGITGALKVKRGAGSQTPACVATFTLNITKSIGESACLGKSWVDAEAGIKDWNASFDGSADFSVTGNKDLMTAIINGEEIEAVFELDDENFFKGDGYLESYSVSHDAEGIATVSGSIVGNGEIETTYESIGE